MVRSAIASKPLVTWVLVADGGQAQIYVRDLVQREMPRLGNIKSSRRLVERTVVQWTPVFAKPMLAESTGLYDVGKDKLSMAYSSVGSARGAGEPKLDVRLEVKQHLARDIADLLKHSLNEGSFDRLVIVAPPKMLGEIESSLDSNVRATIISTLPKDYTHFSGGALNEQLEAIG